MCLGELGLKRGHRVRAACPDGRRRRFRIFRAARFPEKHPDAQVAAAAHRVLGNAVRRREGAHVDPDCESPEGAKTVVPVTRSASLHSASAVMSGLSAASAAASLTSPTTHTGPTSIFITALAGASGIDGICRSSRSAFAGGPFRKMRPSSSTESSISPAPHSWMIFLERQNPTRARHARSRSSDARRTAAPAAA